MEDSKELRTEIYGKLSSNTQAGLFLSRGRDTRRDQGSPRMAVIVASGGDVESTQRSRDRCDFQYGHDGGREKSSGLPANFARIFPDYGTLPNQRTSAGSAGSD